LNKLLIPTILTAIVLIAGVFAFMPIDKASTVHTSIIASQRTLLVDSDSGTGITTGDTIVFDCDKNFTIREIYFTLTDFDSNDGERLTLGDQGTTLDAIIVDGVALRRDNGFTEQFDLFTDFGTLNDVTASISYTGTNIEVTEESIPLFLTAEGAGADDIVFNLNDEGGNAIDASDELTVKAFFDVQSDATCTVSVNT